LVSPIIPFRKRVRWVLDSELFWEDLMSDRADFYIEKVRYNKGHTKIVWVSVREDDGKRLGGAYNMVRTKMVSLMRQGKQFMTIIRNEEGKYRRGQKLSYVLVKGSAFLRTDTDEVEQDQLSDIPEF
jgi:hypothetical protein